MRKISKKSRKLAATFGRLFVLGLVILATLILGFDSKNGGTPKVSADTTSGTSGTSGSCAGACSSSSAASSGTSSTGSGTSSGGPGAGP